MKLCRPGHLSREALARIQAAVRQDARGAHAQERNSRSTPQDRVGDRGGSGVLSPWLLAWVMQPPAPALFGVGAQIGTGETLLDSRSHQRRSLRVGDLLRSGDEITAHGVGLISLASGINLRIGADTLIRALGQNDVELVRGMVYVDRPPHCLKNRVICAYTPVPARSNM